MDIWRQFMYLGSFKQAACSVAVKSELVALRVATVAVWLFTH